MVDKTSRRKKPPKRRRIKERREDMRLIVSASQKDIYLWAFSMALMVGILGIMITISLLKG